MYKIVKKQTLNQAVELMEIHAPYVARKCEPGQFIIIRVDEDGAVWQLALAGGGTMATGSLAAGLGAITPAGWAVIIAIAVVGIATIGIRYTKKIMYRISWDH